ncbi:hypothetical protein AHF37_08963 [Paragonimus kellicotti]|nr:hypothetical protein AHF37_08963 [Paragonimus kellicotti]
MSLEEKNTLKNSLADNEKYELYHMLDTAEMRIRNLEEEDSFGTTRLPPVIGLRDRPFRRLPPEVHRAHVSDSGLDRHRSTSKVVIPFVLAHRPDLRRTGKEGWMIFNEAVDMFFFKVPNQCNH